MRAFPLPYSLLLLHTPSSYPLYLIFIGPGFFCPLSFTIKIKTSFHPPPPFFLSNIFTYRDMYVTVVPTAFRESESLYTQECLNKYHLKNKLSLAQVANSNPYPPSHTTRLVHTHYDTILLTGIYRLKL